MVVVQWTDNAEQDLKAIYQYIALDSPFTAKKFVKKLVQALDDKLYSMPSSGSPIKEFKDSPIDFLMQYSFKNYRIIYNFDEPAQLVTVIAVIHAKRLLTPDLIGDL